MRPRRQNWHGPSPDRAAPELTFEEVITQHLDALYRAALRFSRGHTADAEDLLQDAVLRACERYGDLRDAGAAKAWLFTILARTHLNRRRSQQRRREALESDLSEHEFEEALADWPAAGDVDASWPSAAEVGDAIDALEESLRSAVVLCDIEGFRQREVAAMLEVPEGTVASRLYRARRQLRDKLLGTSGRETGAHRSQRH